MKNDHRINSTRILKQLPAFLEHPIHTKLVEKLKDEVAGSITFDHY